VIRRAAALAALVVCSACQTTPSVVAPGLKRAGVERLRLGMAEPEVRHLLGAPLNDGATSYEPGQAFLVYARLGESRLIGTRTVVDFQPGLNVQLNFGDSRLRRVVILDALAGGSVGCACVHEHCPQDWLAPCASRLPE
jgi:hypothetical protein